MSERTQYDAHGWMRDYCLSLIRAVPFIDSDEALALAKDAWSRFNAQEPDDAAQDLVLRMALTPSSCPRYGLPLMPRAQEKGTRRAAPSLKRVAEGSMPGSQATA